MQGFNMGRYVPPDLEGTISANKLAGKHALGARANKISQGILTVRFEMPFAVWCGHCPKPTIIGQGVRFNAEKKKIGNYYSTPIFSFRMKHVVCGGVIEIRTDPKNTAYVVHEGGKARDTGEDKVREGEEGMEILTAEEREKRREDAFAKLEGKKEDQVQAKEAGKRIRELYEAKERDWDDPYEASRRLRKGFRVERKVREKDQEATEKLKDKMGLGVDLLPEHEDDKKRAAFIEYGPLQDVDDGARMATSRPLFLLEDRLSPEDTSSSTKDDAKKPRLTKKEKESERRRKALENEIRHNSRAAQDPFLTFGASVAQPDTSFRPIVGIKRKRAIDSAALEPALSLLDTKAIIAETAETTEIADAAAQQAQPFSLVAYNSDDSD